VGGLGGRAVGNGVGLRRVASGCATPLHIAECTFHFLASSLSKEIFVSARENDLAAIALQERELCFERFDEEVAWSIGSRLHTMAVARKAGVVIDVRRFGQPLFYCALAGSTPDNAEWVRRKSNLVARFHRSSYILGIETGAALFEKYALPMSDFAAHGGSFPICVQGAGVIGSITVSGLPQRADHELVVEALCVELGKDYGKLALANPAA
jgi:uncharacterized protein (UPF0303 family)